MTAVRVPVFKAAATVVLGALAACLVFAASLALRSCSAYAAPVALDARLARHVAAIQWRDAR